VPIPRRYMLKEHHLRDALKKIYPNLSMIFNKQLGACSKRRPDVFIECHTHSIVIECDEHQHRNTLCEEKRMMEIYQDTNHRPVIFIRFNPDNYNGECCFTPTERGLNINRKEWNSRLKKLRERIDFYMNEHPTKAVQIEYLFYKEGIEKLKIR